MQPVNPRTLAALCFWAIECDASARPLLQHSTLQAPRVCCGCLQNQDLYASTASDTASSYIQIRHSCVNLPVCLPPSWPRATSALHADESLPSRPHGQLCSLCRRAPEYVLGSIYIHTYAPEYWSVRVCGVCRRFLRPADATSRLR